MGSPLRRNARSRGVPRGRILISTLLLLFCLTGCDIVGPTVRDSYTLVSIDGSPLPYVLRRSRHWPTGDVLESIQLGGELTLFVGGRYIMAATIQYFLNGAPYPEFPIALVGSFSGDFERSGTTMVLSRGDFRAEVMLGGNVLLVTDETGLQHYRSFEYRRR